LSALLFLHVRSAFRGGRHNSYESRCARRGKITDVLLDTCGYAAIAWFNIRAMRFDVDRARPWTWLCGGSRCSDKHESNAAEENRLPGHSAASKLFAISLN
jgi:hypothetical protein